MARPARRLGNLPAEATTFIGRGNELAELRVKLRESRLVSLVGPGGVGKTRLALRIGRDLGRAFADGVWVVELADIRDPHLITGALMLALDLRDQSAAEPLTLLLAYLKDKQLLLIVDNCEHLLAPAALLIGQIMRAAAGVRIIATSREPLSVDGEHVLGVPPLRLPSGQEVEPLAQIRANEAVMLFAERALAASAGFQLTDSNRSAVVEVCRRLDGLPLAIELAAVRTRALTVEQIRDRLNDRFSLLTRGGRPALPRHQTLRTTIDWSYELLEAAERLLLGRLSVFAGRFALEDVAAVCGYEGVPGERSFDLLSSLVDKSLVMKEDLAAVACYRLHETMREFARIKLRDAGDEEALEDRCTEYFRSTCMRSMGESRYRLAKWLDWVDLEIDNIRAVIGRCVSRKDVVPGVDLVTAVGWYWITRATTEGIRWLEELAAIGRGNAEAQFWAYFLGGFLAVLKAHGKAAGPALEQAVATARQIGEPSLLSQALSMAANAENLAGDRAQARGYLEEAILLGSRPDDYPARISVLQARSLSGFFDGDIEAVRAAASEGVQLSRAAGDLYSLEMMLLNSGSIALISGDLQQAKVLYTDALKIAQRIDDRVAQYYLLDGLGCVAAGTGRARLAAQLIGAAETVRTQAGADRIPILTHLIEQAETTLAAALGQARFEAEVNAGKGMGRQDAIRLALDETAAVLSKKSRTEPLGLLGKRQAEVARLVAQGLTNKQIGARLFISERTVDSHVRGILDKLGFNSRSQIAGWLGPPDR